VIFSQDSKIEIYQQSEIAFQHFSKEMNDLQKDHEENDLRKDHDVAYLETSIVSASGLSAILISQAIWNMI